MMPEAVPRRCHCLEAILLALAFAVAYTQSPLFYSNQNQYLLHGLSSGGYGHLSSDWLANTRDPTPLFSASVTAGYRYLGLGSLQAAYFLIVISYFLSTRWLVSALPAARDTRSFRLAFAALFTAAHAAIVRLASVELTGIDYPWYLQCGVANQYLLGPGLQPSAFGVAILASLAAFANGRVVLASALAGLACAFHSTYLIPVGLILIGIVLATVRPGGRGGPPAFLGLVAASVLIAPSAAYTLFTFGPRTAHTFEEAQRILAEIRIPHHALIDRWFAEPDAFQLAWIVLGLALLWRSRLFLVAALAAAGGLVLSLVQYATGDLSLALLFPWRISVVLVPVATAAVAALLASRVPPSRLVEAIAAATVLALAAAGTWVMVEGKGYQTNDAELAMLNTVRDHARGGEVYLLPVKFPPIGHGRGTASTTFTPPPRPKPGSNLIPVDLQRFRLHTGAPIYVDFKSVPYFDLEVLEWQRRLRQCEAWYAGDWTALGRAQELRSEGITHVVAPAAQPIAAECLEEVYADPAYIVYRVR